MSRARPLDVAIIGMACRFPGAPDAPTFWENTVAGRDCTGEVPPDRWDPSVFFDPGLDANDRVSCKRGGYLDAPIPFDPTAHGVMPLAVAGGGPEQFLVLDAATAALADAGLGGGVPDGRRVEVVIGRGNYFNRGNLTRLQHGRIVAQTLAILRQLHPDWTDAEVEAVRDDLKASLPPFEAGTIAAQVTNGTAGRVADRLDLEGASYVVDAASASSLVALDLGARALADRRADLALVGGVYLQSDVDFPMVFSRLGALSRSGRARPFARDADGTIPGEGVGVVVLKRLADAERDGDRVYAVLKGVGLSSDGRGAGLASPSARGHARALRRAYRRSGVEPSTVGYVEGHGLGVPASDRAELRALHAVFPARRDGAPRCALGSASALIGHAMPASGMAGLIKAALALHHRVVPPTPHADRPHPLLCSVASPFTLAQKARPWIHGGLPHPRRAGVNAFGFAGINAHAVLEEHPASAEAVTPGCQWRWETEAFLFAGPDRDGLVDRARRLLAWLDRDPNRAVPLKDLASTLNTLPLDGPCRLGLVAESADDLRGRLRGALEKLSVPACRAFRDARGGYFRDEPLGGPGSLAFVFAGEGAQYPGMQAELCRHFPEVRAWFDLGDLLAREQKSCVVPSEPLFGDGGGDLWTIGTAINTVLSSHWALYKLLGRLGVRPDRVVGHSSGEFLALGAAGVLTIDDDFSRRIAELGTTLERLDADGRVPHATLLAVAAGRDRVIQACREVDPGLTVALDNCPHQVIVAGTKDAVDRLALHLRGLGIFGEVLPFARAYHTPGFRAAIGPVDAFFRSLSMSRPAVPIDSCVTAGPMPDDVAEIRRLAVEQWSSPVAFRETVEALYASGARIFVEVGARGNLAGFVEDTLRGRPHLAVAPCLPRRSGLTQLNHTVATLHAHGVPVRTDYLYARRRPTRVDLDRPWPTRQAPALAVGFPEMRLSPELAAQLIARDRGPEIGTPGVEPTHADANANGRNGHAPLNRLEGVLGREGESRPATDGAPRESAKESMDRQDPDPRAALIRAHLRTMDEFLETQRQVMDAYLARRRRGIAPSQSLEAYREGEEVGGSRRRADPHPASGHPLPGGEGNLAFASARETSRSSIPLLSSGPVDLPVPAAGNGMPRPRPPGRKAVEGSALSAEGALLEQVCSPSPSPSTGPWLGAIESIEPGRSLVAVRRLDRDDPVAGQHTLGGRRVSAIDPARLGLPVVPFTVMTEMLAQAAARLMPGRAVVGFRDVQAHRWIRYEGRPIDLEIRADCVPGQSDEVRVAIFSRGSSAAAGRKGNGDGPFVEGRVFLGDRRAAAPAAPRWELDDPRPCKFAAGMIYRDQWLFHGPAFQAVVEIGRVAPRGIEGTLRVLPRRGLFRDGEEPGLVTDPVVLDAFTHLFGCWSLDEIGDDRGDVIFPMRMAGLSLFDADPGEGADVSCRIRVVDVQRHRVRVDADFVAPDGRVWMRLNGYDGWRFYWPARYRDHFRMPDRVFLGEPLDLRRESTGSDSRPRAVWLQPPADFGKSVWREVLECLNLGPEERDECWAQPGPESRATHRLWGRIAAKEAVRRVRADRGLPPLYPADLKIEPDGRGRPRVRSLLEHGRADLPAVSIAHAEGVAVALASPDPDARVGIDVEPIEGRSPEFERLAFSDAERARLDRLADPDDRASRAEWVGRFWCAKEAVAKATGLGLVAGPGSVAVVDADAATGDVDVALGPELAAACPDPGDRPLRAVTARRGDYVWAWTLAERID